MYVVCKQKDNGHGPEFQLQLEMCGELGYDSLEPAETCAREKAELFNTPHVVLKAVCKFTPGRRPVAKERLE